MTPTGDPFSEARNSWRGQSRDRMGRQEERREKKLQSGCRIKEKTLTSKKKKKENWPFL